MRKQPKHSFTATSVFPAPAELLPHCGEMLMIDRVLSCDSTDVLCKVRHRFGRVASSGRSCCWTVAVECMAQAAGCLGGILHQQSPKAGMLVAVRQLSPRQSSLPLDEVSFAEAKLLYSDATTSQFHCRFRIGDERTEIVSARLTLVHEFGAS